MVGSNSFHQIDQRKKQIFSNEKPFGGLSIIVVGDFWQLKPTEDTYMSCTLNETIYFS
jgi:hypothetical protein